MIRNFTRIFYNFHFITTFFLCIFGTFMTRCGIVSSVHAFATSTIGNYFLVFLTIGIAFMVVPKTVTGVDPTGLRVSLNDTLDDASPLVQQTTWTADSGTNTFTGTLDLNTAGMNSYVGSASSVSAYLQIEFSQSGGGWTPVYQQSITVKNSVTQPTSTSPDPVQTYRTADESDGLYDTPIMRQGVFKVIISSNGQWQRVLGVDDNGTAVDQILPYP